DLHSCPTRRSSDLGALHQEEWRNAVLDLLDIQNPKPGLPESDHFNNAHPTVEEAQAAADKLAAMNKSSDPVARQGNSGATGGDKSETNHDGDADTYGNE